ncbi:MAG: AAA family ATPase, partial [Pseudoflavonifractor sp.]
YVGIGASRVRDLFDQAKKNAPSIVFIDEIDAVGRQRGTGLGGGHDEREQTLNQLLVEMDGFGTNEGVIVMAATNRQDILDPAILRPGRFDRQIYVGVPDIQGREEILKIHARNKPLGENVDLREVAKATGGFTGADLENLMNEAALLAARKQAQFISMEQIHQAVIKVIAGPEKKSRVVTPRERRLTAYHEAGHAVVSHGLETADPVHQITIVPHGMAGGMTISLPQEDKSFLSKLELSERIVSLLGGRVAEAMVLGDISTGAGNDIQRASTIARNMIMRYGMSEKLGNVVFDSGHDEVFIGRSMAQTKTYSEAVAAVIDSEVKAIIDAAYARCEEILTRERATLEKVAEYLMEYETMDAATFDRAFTDPNFPEEPEKAALPTPESSDFFV